MSEGTSLIVFDTTGIAEGPVPGFGYHNTLSHLAGGSHGVVTQVSNFGGLKKRWIFPGISETSLKCVDIIGPGFNNPKRRTNAGRLDGLNFEVARLLVLTRCQGHCKDHSRSR